MRIKEFVISNFKNIGIQEPCRIIFPSVSEHGSYDFLTIIGENNVGKSSVLEALRLFLPETNYVNVPDINMFPNREEPQSEDKYMKIQIEFNDFSQDDKEHRYIKPYIYNNELKVRRVWKSSGLKDSEVPFEVFIPNREISELTDASTLNNRAFSQVSERLQELYRQYCLDNGIAEGGTIQKGKKEDFIEYVYLMEPTLISESEGMWIPNPNGFASKIRSIMPKVIYVPAVKIINDEADPNKSKSAANEILSAIFENELNNTNEILAFQEALTNIKNIFQGETQHSAIGYLQQKLNKKLNRIMELEADVDFNTPEVMEKLHLNSNIYLKHRQLRTEPVYQGNGAQRILILALLELMAEQLINQTLEDRGEGWKRSFLFLIEEPEIYLHPQYQRKMRDVLIDISQNPFAQIICTSHSEKFIDLADRHQGIVLFKKNDNGFVDHIQVVDNIYSGETSKEKRSRIRMLLNFTSSTLEAFFAERVILVEGDCEVASILALQNKLTTMYPSKSQEIAKILKGITIIPCGGKLTQLAFFEVLEYFGVQSYLIHDLDAQLRDEGNNKIILDTIGTEDLRLTHSPNFEGDIFGEEWVKDKPWKAVRLIEDDFERYADKLLRFLKFIVGHEKFMQLNLTNLEVTTA